MEPSVKLTANVIWPQWVLKFVQFSSSICLPLTLLRMPTTKKEYLNQAIAFLSSKLPPSSTTAHTSLVLLVQQHTPVSTRTLQFRKAYLALLGIQDDHLSQFATGDSRPQDGHRVHVPYFHLP